MNPKLKAVLSVLVGAAGGYAVYAFIGCGAT